jgi:hypothetical protein
LFCQKYLEIKPFLTFEANGMVPPDALGEVDSVAFAV